MLAIIEHITSQLAKVYPDDEALALAWWLVEEQTGLTRSQILTGCKDTKIFANVQAFTADNPHLEEFIDRLVHYEPIQYIFGHTIWDGLDLLVTPDTLIPRPETAELVEKINEAYPPSISSPVSVLDIGTGSGCIAIDLKRKHPHWQVTGVDISQKALDIARQNATRNNVDIHFLQLDIMADLPDFIGSFDLVVSNPPYIRESEKTTMRPNVLQYEPSTALFVNDNDPLLFYRRIASLHISPRIFFEINEAFAAEVQDLLRSNRYTDTHTYKDIYGKERIVEGRMA